MLSVFVVSKRLDMVNGNHFGLDVARINCTRRHRIKFGEETPLRCV